MATDSYTDRDNQINDKTLPAFCLIFAIFVGGLILNTTLGVKIVDIFGFYLPAGIFLWSLTFPLTDIVAETYGRKYALYLVLGGLSILLLSLVMIQFAMWLQPAPFWQNEEAYNTILGANIRLILAQIASFVVTQVADIYIFSWIRKKTNGKHLWLRNNISTFTSQLLANCIFLSIAFLGTMPMEVWLTLFVTNLVGRIILALLDTPIVYAGVHLVRRAHPSLKV
jgi:uncharacterized integral membrane protein (TIGR00697 family)